MARGIFVFLEMEVARRKEYTAFATGAGVWDWTGAKGLMSISVI